MTTKNKYIIDNVSTVLNGILNLGPQIDEPFDLAIKNTSDMYDALVRNGIIQSSNDIYSDPKEKVPYQKIVDLYHKKFPSKARVYKLSPTRKGYIKRLWDDKEDGLPDSDNWTKFFEKVEASDFLMGRTGGDRPFKLSLEWITKPANFIKIAEGFYDNGVQ